MEILNMNKIIDQYEVNETELSRVLFNQVRYPEYAFRRVLQGNASLSSEQVSILANYLQVPVSDLFTEQETDWHATSKNGQLTFYKGPYKILVSREKFKVTIIKGKDVVDEAVGAIGLMTIQDFLEEVDKKIQEFEDKVNNK